MSWWGKSAPPPAWFYVGGIRKMPILIPLDIMENAVKSAAN